MDELKELQGMLEVWAVADAAAQAAPDDAKDAAEKDAKTALKLLQAALDDEAAQDEGGADAVRKRLLAVCSRTNGDNPPEDSGELRKWICDALFPPPRPPRSVAEIKEPRPAPLLRLAGLGGAFLTRGSVALVAGEGGIGKSALLCSLAVEIASGGEQGPLVLHEHNLELVKDQRATGDAAARRPVLLVGYEDDAATVAWRCRQYRENGGTATGADNSSNDVSLSDVWVMTPAGSLFGPVAAKSGAELYNARPDKQPQWRALESAIVASRPVLVVIDPALEAFSGDANNGSAVREFLRALRQLATRYQIGILLVAHSTKAARVKSGQQDDPFRVGQVGGTSHWTDGCRAAAALDWSGSGEDPFTGRRLAVLKANYGPSRLVCELEPIRSPAGAIVGFKRDSKGWRDPQAPEATNGETNGKKNGKKNKHGVAL